MLNDPNFLPLCVLAVLGAALLLWGIISWWRTGLSLPQFMLYVVDQAVTRLWWGAQVTGELPPRDEGGAIIICNHISSVDPFFIQLAARTRIVHWMVAKEYFAQPVFGAILRLAQAIPVGRGGFDTAATKLAIRYAQQNGVVGLFPEGMINITDELMLPGWPGAAMIALETRMPVIPCFLSGVPYHDTVLSPLFSPARVQVIIGTAVDLSEYYGREKEDGVLEKVTKLLLASIAELGGYPEFIPQVAGKRRRKRRLELQESA